jgi:hypothetical protein
MHLKGMKKKMVNLLNFAMNHKEQQTQEADHPQNGCSTAAFLAHLLSWPIFFPLIESGERIKVKL